MFLLQIEKVYIQNDFDHKTFRLNKRQYGSFFNFLEQKEMWFKI